MSSVIAILLLVPLVASCASFLWANLWQTSYDLPVRRWIYRSWIILEIAVCVSIVALNLKDWFAIVGSAYAALFLTAAWLKIAKPAGTACGCWTGSNSPTTWWLVIGDAVASIAALRLAGTQESPEGLTRFAILFNSSLLAFIGVVSIPEVIHFWKRLTQLSAHYSVKISDRPELA